jgi:N12 class adenine-specific DNA methylase
VACRRREGGVVLAGELEIGEMVAFLTLVGFLYDPIERLHQLNQLVQSGRAAAERVFELTPVQRLVSRFMHPLTPYMGLLLFHGVGVGKTCAAVTIAEQFLEATPTNKVIVLVPQALKENYKHTVVDPSKLEWDSAAGQWQTRQCTGLSYLERLGLLHNPDMKAVTFKLEEDRRNRYTVTGYQAFANWIDRTLKKNVPMVLTDPDVRRAAENEVLRRLFSDHLIIVDEAHNLRDLAAGSGDAVAGGEAAENQGGKALNPFLRRIVVNAEGLRLVLMTATPMYNLASEIVLLLNYLIMNDAKSEKAALNVGNIFTKDGGLLKPKILEKFARRYVSYMRGENPYTFPLRMHPLNTEGTNTEGTKPASMWPARRRRYRGASNSCET